MTDGRKNLTSPNGNVRTLLTFRKAVVIYDLTFHFTQTFLVRGDRTIDQMIQAARSGKQNIAEGSAAGVTSMETAIKLTNVAKDGTVKGRPNDFAKNPEAGLTGSPEGL